MKRIVIFSDSLALPRYKPQVTLFEDTYPYLLRKNFDVFQFSKGGGLISELVEQAHYYKQYNPDYVILHCGIVDCGCRAFTYNEELFFRSNILGRIVRKALSVSITTKRLRNFRKKSWTDEITFINNCNEFKKIFLDVPVFAISILPVTDEYEKSVPGIRNKVIKYNSILKEIFNEFYIDISDIQKNGIMTDGHHLTCNGHKFVFEQILLALKYV